MLMSAAGLVLIALSLAVKMLLQGPTRPGTLPTVPAITSTILAEALADTARPMSAYSSEPVSIPQEPGTSYVPLAVADAPAPVVPDSAITLAASTPPADAGAVLQGEPRDVPPPRPGRLHITVENARRPDAARLFADAVAAHRAGEISTARKLYDRVLVLTPNDAEALNNLGVLLSSQGEYARALQLLRRANEASPRNPGPWNNIGTVFHAQGKHSEAIAAFRQALALDAQHPGAKVGLAQQYLAIQSLEQARGLLDDVVTAHPELPEAHYTLGQVLELQGDRASAVKAYEEFVRVAPGRLASHVDLVKRRIETLSSGR